MSHSRWIIGTVLAFLLVAMVLTSLISGIGSSLYANWQLVFQHADSSFHYWGLAAISTGCVAAIAALFRYEQQLISWPLGLLLLGLRVCLVLIIFLSLLQPVWSWTSEEQKAKRLLLAIDVSESMETVDRQASQSEKIRWADAMRMLGNKDQQARIAEWIKAAEAGREPEWVPLDEAADFQKRQRLAQVRRENLKSQLQELESLSRLEILRRMFLANSQPLLEELKSLTTLQLAAFAESTAPMEFEEFKTPDQLTSLQLGRSHSNLSEAADAARIGAGTVPLAGVVLFSDGRDTESGETAKLLNRLQGLGVPVHTVLIGSEYRPRDLSILKVDHPESVFLKDKPLVKATLQTSGFEGEEVKVFLEDLDAPEKDPIEKVLTPAKASSEVSFQLEDLPVGRHRYRVGAGLAPNEIRDDNNSSEFSIHVVDDRARVLLVDGESRWEFRFLDAALSRDEQIQVDHVLFEQPFLRVLKQPFFPTSIDELHPEVTTGTPFAPYDLVLIGDVSPQDLPPQRWQQLDKYVREEGGTLVLTAGKRFFPMAYQGTLAEALLPVQNLREVRVDDALQTGSPAVRGFRLAISPDGEQLPMFQLSNNPDASQKIWHNLPGHMWGIAGVARGGASVWASSLLPNQVNNLEQERQNGLIVQHYVGDGQVIWIGVDSTWRWRYLVGDLYHHRFWGQLIRWAVAFKASAGNDTVRLGLRESVIDEGQTAFLQARWDQRFLARNPGLKVEAVFRQSPAQGTFQQTIDMKSESGNTLVFSGDAPNLPAGEYTIQLKVTGTEPIEELPEVTLIVNAKLSVELQDVTSNRALLQEIANSTGGRFLLPNELDQLPDLFRNAKQTERVRQEIPLYGHWSILLLFCTVATTEWVLRKLNGLP